MGFVGGAGGPFTPASLPGLLVWLKADSLGLANNDPVVSYPDSSGNANHFTGTGSPLFKTGVINGLPAVYYPVGSIHRMTSVNYLPGNPTSGECFFVMKVDADVGLDLNVLHDFGIDPAANHWPFTDGTVYDGWGTDVRKTLGNPTPSLASWRLVNLRSEINSYVAEIDGGALFSTGTNSVAFNTQPYIGGNAIGAQALVGHIAEYMQYDHVLSSGDRQQVEDYVETKYALTIP